MPTMTNTTGTGTQGKPEVVNLHHNRNIFNEQGCLYIGRPKTGGNEHFGNPFTHLGTPTLAACKVGSRDESVDTYKSWLDGTSHQEVEPKRRVWILNNLDKVRQARKVICFCAPNRCHGEPLIDKAFEKAPKKAPEKDPGPTMD